MPTGEQTRQAGTAGVPAIEGWFEPGDAPHLLGRRCGTCGTYAFPPTTAWCPNPACDCTDTEVVPLSRTATVWSYTDARYAPPPPYVPTSDPYEPFAIVAAELTEERLIVLGQAATGVGTADLTVGAPVELVVEPLYDSEGTPRLVWRWKPVSSPAGRPGGGA